MSSGVCEDYRGSTQGDTGFDDLGTRGLTNCYSQVDQCLNVQVCEVCLPDFKREPVEVRVPHTRE